IYDIESRAIGIYRGYGAHLDPEIAMIRALTEAAQGRLIYISGSRDDFFRCNYRRLKRGDDERAIDYIERSPETIDARDRENESSDTFEEDIIRVFEKLKRVNVNQIIALDLTLPEFDIAVVRIIGPGLEGYKFDYYSPGQRALAFLEKINSENGELCK
ncbi:MAG: YcaO-like family protein, partial [Candidatus Scalindua sp.]|nr:YcaO-like family protein [Candidatus Scalindua sp.]